MKNFDISVKKRNSYYDVIIGAFMGGLAAAFIPGGLLLVLFGGIVGAQIGKTLNN
jgi:uncharacterized membrane protein YeaQ/YmgE (transglycosylase-associated protein family)